MEKLKGHRFRLDPSGNQASLCSRTAGICRCLWNLALEQRSSVWRYGRHRVGYNTQSADLAELKAAYPWVADAPHHCLQ
jgi:putative transposase